MAQQAAPLPTTYNGSQQRNTLQQIFGRDWKIAFTFIAPIVFLMIVLIAWPFIKALYTSMTIRNMALRKDVFVGFDNYVRLYSDPFYRQAVKATFVFTGGAITFKVIFGIIAAMLLHSQKRFKNILTGMILLPWIVPSVVQALTWKSIYDPIFGGLDPILMNLGLIQQARGLAIGTAHRDGCGRGRQCVGRNPVFYRQPVGRTFLH